MVTMATQNGTMKTPINLDFMSDEELDRYLRAEENKDSIFEINGKLYTISTHTVSEDGNVTTKLKRVKMPREEERSYPPTNSASQHHHSVPVKQRASATAPAASSSMTQHEEEMAKQTEKSNEDYARRLSTPEGFAQMNNWMNKAVKAADWDQVVQLLKQCRHIQLNVDLLRSNDTAKLIKTLTKRSDVSPEVRRLSETVHSEWRSYVAVHHNDVNKQQPHASTSPTPDSRSRHSIDSNLDREDDDSPSSHVIADENPTAGSSSSLHSNNSHSTSTSVINNLLPSSSTHDNTQRATSTHKKSSSDDKSKKRRSTVKVAASNFRSTGLTEGEASAAKKAKVDEPQKKTSTDKGKIPTSSSSNGTSNKPSSLPTNPASSPTVKPAVNSPVQPKPPPKRVFQDTGFMAALESAGSKQLIRRKKVAPVAGVTRTASDDKKPQLIAAKPLPPPVSTTSTSPPHQTSAASPTYSSNSSTGATPRQYSPTYEEKIDARKDPNSVKLDAKGRKRVHFADMLDMELTAVRYFEVDQTERANVHRQGQPGVDMKHREMQMERQMKGQVVGSSTLHLDLMKWKMIPCQVPMDQSINVTIDSEAAKLEMLRQASVQDFMTDPHRRHEQYPQEADMLPRVPDSKTPVIPMEEVQTPVEPSTVPTIDVLGLVNKLGSKGLLPPSTSSSSASATTTTSTPNPAASPQHQPPVTAAPRQAAGLLPDPSAGAQMPTGPPPPIGHPRMPMPPGAMPPWGMPGYPMPGMHNAMGGMPYGMMPPGQAGWMPAPGMMHPSMVPPPHMGHPHPPNARPPAGGLLGSGPPNDASKNEKPEAPDPKMCTYFLQGRCTYDLKCKFSHGAEKDKQRAELDAKQREDSFAHRDRNGSGDRDAGRGGRYSRDDQLSPRHNNRYSGRDSDRRGGYRDDRDRRRSPPARRGHSTYTPRSRTDADRRDRDLDSPEREQRRKRRRTPSPRRELSNSKSPTDRAGSKSPPPPSVPYDKSSDDSD